MAKPPIKPKSTIKPKVGSAKRPAAGSAIAGRPQIPPGRMTVSQLLNSTRGNFFRQDWSRAKAQGRHFEGDKGRIYNTKIDIGKASRAPWGIRFQTTTTDPIEFGVDARGRYPRKWVQYIELPFDYNKTNVRGHREFRVFCNCPRYKFAHHYVLWRAGHAPKPRGKGLEAPDYTRRGSRAPAVCKHLVLALLAVNKISAQNRLPELLPDKAWAEIERYWAGVESGNSGEAMMANLANAPDSVKKLAAKVATSGAPKRSTGNNFSKRDWSDRGIVIPRKKY